MMTKIAASDSYHGRYNNLGWWIHHVTEMSRRKTTGPKDRLHALDGVLHRLKSTFDDHEFLWVLPSSALEVALLWWPQHRGGNSSIRNAAVDNSGVVIPSWSWAGYAGEVYYREYNLCETA
jgi:hypothetical protein